LRRVLDTKTWLLNNRKFLATPPYNPFSGLTPPSQPRIPGNIRHRLIFDKGNKKKVEMGGRKESSLILKPEEAKKKEVMIEEGD
jgi:hypothetical protein